MDFARILAELHQEKEAIEEAILSIERLAGTHRRGRPPGTADSMDAPRKRGRPKGSKNKPPDANANANANAASGASQG